MRLIDANAFVEKCKDIIQEEQDNRACVSWPFAYENVIDEINERPTIDAVPVVRCKDCKWYNDCEDYDLCVHPDYGRYTTANGFCESGEMKEDEID